MKLEFNQEAISQNDKIFGTNKGNSRFLYKKFRDSFLMRLKHLGTNEENRTAWKITRHWGAKKRLFDEANLIGGFKPIIDSMQKVGIIKDDSPKYFKAYYFQQKSESGKGFITIEKLSEAEEIETALLKIAEGYELDESVLIELGRKVGLIK